MSHVVPRHLPAPRYDSVSGFPRSPSFQTAVPVLELLALNEKSKKLINRGFEDEGFLAAAVESGHVTLREAGLRRMSKGLTTFEEVLRM